MINDLADRLERAARFDLDEPAAQRAAQSTVWTLEQQIQNDYKNGCETCKGCKNCDHNKKMASAIRAKDSYQQVLRDFWEGKSWNPLPWAAEFYENEYNFARYYLGGDHFGLASMATVSVLARRAPLPELPVLSAA